MHLQRGRPSASAGHRLLEGQRRQQSTGHHQESARPFNPEQELQRSSVQLPGAVREEKLLHRDAGRPDVRQRPVRMSHPEGGLPAETHAHRLRYESFD